LGGAWRWALAAAGLSGLVGVRAGWLGQPIVPRAIPFVPSTRQRIAMSGAAPSRAGPAQTSSQDVARTPELYSRMYRLTPSECWNFVRGSGRVLASTRSGVPNQ